jgi:16S rRNA (adenine1518-N6/adenine1519-N6)-dimethyltransferase
MKLSEMRRVLSERELTLTKSLGQNFLHDQNQLQRIVAGAELTQADQVLEIGPGLGPLTELLLEKAGKVLAIEMDARLVEFLKDKFQRSNLELRHGDALRILREERRDWSAWKLVANLPYSVASPILVELAQSPQRPERMVVTLQREVACRLLAQPDDADYGLLTLLVQLDYEKRGSFKIPADCFFPPPRVESTCVVLTRRPQSLLPEEDRAAFVKIVKRAFSQRRKMMLKLLKQDWPRDRLEAVLVKMGISLQERAEKLSLLQFVQLTRELNERRNL